MLVALCDVLKTNNAIDATKHVIMALTAIIITLNELSILPLSLAELEQLPQELEGSK